MRNVINARAMGARSPSLRGEWVASAAEPLLLPLPIRTDGALGQIRIRSESKLETLSKQAKTNRRSPPGFLYRLRGQAQGKCRVAIKLAPVRH
jgi:hypothetical protein